MSRDHQATNTSQAPPPPPLPIRKQGETSSSLLLSTLASGRANHGHVGERDRRDRRDGRGIAAASNSDNGDTGRGSTNRNDVRQTDETRVIMAAESARKTQSGRRHTRTNRKQNNKNRTNTRHIAGRVRDPPPAPHFRCGAPFVSSNNARGQPGQKPRIPPASSPAERGRKLHPPRPLVNRQYSRVHSKDTLTLAFVSTKKPNLYVCG